ncbi:MAG: alpha-amylase family glycosyl hydrolase [Oscillospiraceae bacterium]|nr:alpha-amylase family glycosyl hydrolase [Oscillospiraceae bacterium]
MNWFENAVIYQIYPIGYCGVERRNSFNPPPAVGEGRILRVIKHIPEIKRLGFNAVMFNPLFESTAHGYDTIDYSTVDSRLGTNEDFKQVCDELRKNGLKIILDGVFNHVGRDFAKFKDVQQNKFNSRYKDWFFIRDGNSNYNDGFYYEGWEGHYDLVKLNLYNPEVKDFLMQAISGWVKEFDIDGLRLDVAYSLEANFLKELRNHCKGLKNDFWLLGETLHGDYNKWLNPEMLDSVTNYECYKGLYSSFNELNMFEIAHSLNRQFGAEHWCLYTGKKLACFVDNHDVTRIATQLKEPKHLTPLYTLLFTMPGAPIVYCGSEYGQTGDKHAGDDTLRPEYKAEDYDSSGELPTLISKLTRAHSGSSALHSGSYKQLHLTNRQFSFIREHNGEQAVVLLNADGNPFTFNLSMNKTLTDAISGSEVNLSSPITLPAFGSMVLVSSDSLKSKEGM